MNLLAMPSRFLGVCMIKIGAKVIILLRVLIFRN